MGSVEMSTKPLHASLLRAPAQLEEKPLIALLVKLLVIFAVMPVQVAARMYPIWAEVN